MKLLISTVLLGSILTLGCARPEPPVEEPTPDKTAATAQPQQGSGSTTVQPLVPGAGTATPVGGSESLDGAGMGGIGDSVKKKARSLPGASNNPPPSTDRPVDGE